jgi:CRP-like cAMP-binding protein
MVLDWIAGGRGDVDVNELIARKKYAKAIEVLRAQFKERPPGVQLRLQFVDLLVLAGRGKEAVPVLLGLAEELVADGFATKAVAILKRIEKIEPGRRDVEALLGSLVKSQYSGAPAPRPAPVPEFGIEEIGDSPDVASEAAVSSEAPAMAETPGQPADNEGQAADNEGQPADSEGQPADSEGQAGVRTDAPDSAPPRDAAAEPSAPSEAGPESDSGAEPPVAEVSGASPDAANGAKKSVTSRIRGAFRRFLASLPAGDEAEEGAAEAGEAPAAAEGEPPLEFEPGAPASGSADAAEIAEIAAPTAIEADALPAGPAGSADMPLAEAPDDAGAAEAVVSADAISVDAEPEVTLDMAPEPAVEGAAEPAVVLDTQTSAPVADESSPGPEAAEAAEASDADIAPASDEVVPTPDEVLATRDDGASEPPAIEIEPDAVTPQVAVEPEPIGASAEDAGVLPEVAAQPTASGDGMSQQAFQNQVLDLMLEVLHEPVPPPAAPAAAPVAEAEAVPVKTRGVAQSAQQLVSCPLFRDLSEEELLAVVRGMRLHTYEAGEVAMTEGEPGDSVLIVTTGEVRMFVKNPAGHNFEMGKLKEGDFFGELSSLSGRPRTATVVAATHCELLELDKRTVDHIARTRPRVRETLENYYIQRASSPEAAAIRAVPMDPASRQRAIEVLEAYFGESRWDPRMRLRLADLLVKAGKDEDAVPLLVGLAEELDRAGFPEKAIAILKKIERIRKRHIEEVNLAPLKKKGASEKGPPKHAPVGAGAAAGPRAGGAAAPPAKRGAKQATQAYFENWIVDVVRDAVVPAEAAAPSVREAPAYTPGLKASPLFQGMSEDELLTLIRELKLLSFDPGDVILTEGEVGQSLFVLTAGSVRVFVRSPSGRNVAVCVLHAGSFFGEMATVSGKPRTATVTARERCELLELDKAGLDRIAAVHPRVREVIEEYYIERAQSREAARTRGAPRT